MLVLNCFLSLAYSIDVVVNLLCESIPAAKDIEDNINRLVAEGMTHQEAELKGVEDFAVECSILKVAVSEDVQNAADEGLQQNQFDLLLSDYDLGGKINGLNVIDFARQIAPTTKTLIMSGKSLGEETVLEPTGFIEKPVTRDKLIEILC